MPVETEIDITTMLPATFTAPGLTESQFMALCAKYPDWMLEYTAEGTLIVMPPTDPESSERVAEVVLQLGTWAKQEGSGRFTGPDGGFFFHRGSRRSPDATWFSKPRWEEARKPDVVFPVFAPDFVIEVLSPTDRRRTLREKMQEYIDNGVQLGWLIDPFERSVTIYRPAQDPEVLEHPRSVAGEGPVAGFVLQLDQILNG